MTVAEIQQYVGFDLVDMFGPDYENIVEGLEEKNLDDNENVEFINGVCLQVLE